MAYFIPIFILFARLAILAARLAILFAIRLSRRITRAVRRSLRSASVSFIPPLIVPTEAFFAFKRILALRFILIRIASLMARFLLPDSLAFLRFSLKSLSLLVRRLIFI